VKIAKNYCVTFADFTILNEYQKEIPDKKYADTYHHDIDDYISE